MSEASMSVLVICKGNVCRSPFAAESMRIFAAKNSCHNLKFRSAGTDDQIDGKSAHFVAALIAKEYSVDLSNHVAHQVTTEDIDWSDVVVVMDDQNASRLKQLFPERIGKKTVRWLGQELPGGREIPDPHERPIEAFRKCLATIAAASESFVLSLAPPG